MSLSKAFDIGCDILLILSSKNWFANAVIVERSFWRLLQLLEQPEIDELAPIVPAADYDHIGEAKRVLKAWSVAEALSSSLAIVSEILSTTGWIELLGILVGYAEFSKVWTARVGAGKILSRLLWDPRLGTVTSKLLYYH
jgi:hypothetical protein